jgi:hypothetical protein
MKRNKWERIGVSALSLALACTLVGCGDDGPPESYTLGEETISALQVPEEDEEVAFTAQEGEDDPTTYTYDGLTDPGAVSQTYVQQLTEAEESPFALVDEDLVETEEPDYTASEGTALLARAGAEDGTVNVLSLSWSDTTCTVALDTREGEITEPVTEEEAQEEEASGESLSLTGALDYFESLSPSQLGLEGESMDEYRVYSMDGAVTVDGRACLRLQVYGLTDDNTNKIAGNYLISGDRLHVYRVDEVTGTVVEINL